MAALGYTIMSLSFVGESGVFLLVFDYLFNGAPTCAQVPAPISAEADKYLFIYFKRRRALRPIFII